MGIGRDLGLKLRLWIQDARFDPAAGNALANRLLDALGAEETLRGPLRDFAAQPLTRRVLQTRGGEQQAALQALSQLLGETYSPRVHAELLDLLEAATGLVAERPRGSQPAGATPAQSSSRPAAPASNEPSSSASSSNAPGSTPTSSSDTSGSLTPTSAAWPRRSLPRSARAWLAEIRPMGPGLLAGAVGALVLAWLANELDRSSFERLGWSSGVALAFSLALLQILSLLPLLRRMRQRWPLELASSGEPRRSWRWISAGWIHSSGREALLNVLMLLILLGPTPLGAGKVVLRFSLTTLATLAPALLVARLRGVPRRWCGASGAIAALTALAAGISLLQGRELAFTAGPFRIPAWVLLVIYGGLQLSWQLPSQGPDDPSRPAERLWSSPWWWGTLLGLLWALISWCSALLQPLLRGGQGG